MPTTSSQKAVLLAVLCGSCFSEVAGFVTPNKKHHQGHTATRTLQFAVLTKPTGTLSRTPTHLFMADEEEDSDERSDLLPTGEGAEEEKNFLQKFNDFLDTPILDANNRSDEGPVKELLKEFSRDEPELAQISFSVVVIVILLGVTKFVTG